MGEALDSISNHLIDAAYDPAGWTKALNTINSFVSGSGVVLLSVDERLRHAPRSSDLHEMMEDYFQNGWHSIDRREGCRSFLVRNELAFDYQFIEMEGFESSNYYADFLAKHGRKWFAGVGASLDGDLWCLALQRSPDKGPFLPSEVQRLRALQARLHRSALVARVISQSWFRGASAAFEMDGIAMVLLDRYGRVIEMNSQAQAIFENQMTKQGFIRVSDRKFESELKSMLDLRVQSSSREGAASRFDIEIDRRKYNIDMTNVRGNRSHVFSRACILVRAEEKIYDIERIMLENYGLTTSEKEVALALFSGRSVRDIAEMRCINENTVRKHLKAIFAKTETGSQAKLVSLMAGLSVGSRASGSGLLL